MKDINRFKDAKWTIYKTVPVPSAHNMIKDVPKGPSPPPPPNKPDSSKFQIRQQGKDWVLDGKQNLKTWEPNKIDLFEQFDQNSNEYLFYGLASIEGETHLLKVTGKDDGTQADDTVDIEIRALGIPGRGNGAGGARR